MAKKFQFRLEKLLQLKAHDESLKQKDLAVSTKKVFNQQDALSAIDNDRLSGHDHKRKLLKGQVDPDRLVRYSRYFLKLKKDQITGGEVLKALEAEREQKRKELLEATRRRKILEKLKEKKRLAREKQIALADQKELDEIASNYCSINK